MWCIWFILFTSEKDASGIRGRPGQGSRKQGLAWGEAALYRGRGWPSERAPGRRLLRKYQPGEWGRPGVYGGLK